MSILTRSPNRATEVDEETILRTPKDDRRPVPSAPQIWSLKMEAVTKGTVTKYSSPLSQPMLASPIEAQSLLASIVASSDDAIISKSPTGIITSWNQGAEKIFGYTAEEAIGQHISLLAVPGDPPDMPSILDRILRGERIDHYETRRRAKNGEVLDISLTVSPVRDAQGTIIGASKIARNVTSLKQAEDVLRRSEKLAVIGRMAASIAHEINNPLEAVTNLLYLLNGHVQDPQGIQFLEDAQRELARVAAITAQTLSFYRHAVSPSKQDITSMLRATVDFYRARLSLANIAVERRYRPCPPILCLEGELRQVFMNLIGNGIDAMPMGGRLLIRIRSASDPKTGSPTVRVTFADTGVGLAPAIQEHLFEPFHTTKGAGGTGLGLWVSHEIVRKHKGTIRVRSSPVPHRSGTVFVISFPTGTPLTPPEGFLTEAKNLQTAVPSADFHEIDLAR
jgi:PAS domain S-box-containing protein